MISFDHDYKEMRRRCESYHSLIDQLRDHAYGYEVSLDRLLPYRAAFSMEPVGKRFMGIDPFLQKLIFYTKHLSSEVSEAFSDDASEKDFTYMKAMSTCILFYLHSECRSADYTFLGFVKITKSFLIKCDDPVQSKNRNSAPFWFMYTDISEEKRNAHPKDVKEAFSILFDDFDCNYASKIANRLLHTLRFFLYDQKLDYLSDRLMNMALSDMVHEIIGRLKSIHENRLPRIGWRSYDSE